MYLCKLLRTIFWQSFHYQFSTSTTWPSIMFFYSHNEDIRQSFPFVDLHLIFEISSFYKLDFWTWFVVYIFRTGFLKATQAVKIKFEIDKKSSSKIQSKNQFCELDISKIKCRSTGGYIVTSLWIKQDQRVES